MPYYGGERNIANIVGVRPYAPGTEIMGTSTVTNATTVVYTVPAGYRLHLFNTHITAISANSGAGFKSAQAYITDDVSAIVYRLHYGAFSGYGSSVGNQNRFAPLILPSGYQIVGATNAADVSILISYHGVLVDNGIQV